MERESVLFIGGPLADTRHDVDCWPVEVVRDLPRFSANNFRVGARHEFAAYDRLVAAGADKRTYVLGVFRGWPTDA